MDKPDTTTGGESDKNEGSASDEATKVEDIPDKNEAESSESCSEAPNEAVETIQKQHLPSKVEEREGHCYCGKDRNLNIVELMCASCQRWFHESCIGYQLGKLVPFMMNYIFVCKNCSPTGLESFKKTQAHFTQMIVTAIANLIQTSNKDGQPKLIFSKDIDIIPFIDSHWEGMTTMPRRVTQSWHATITKALIKDLNVIFSSEGDTPLYGLSCLELTTIRPNYEAMIKGGSLKVTDMGIQHVPLSAGFRGRSTKRKFPDQAGGPGKKRGGGDLNAMKLPSHGYPLDHPYNKDGYRYILAEPDPHAPFRQEFDESSDWAGKPIPGWLYRTLVPSVVLLALHDRAAQLRVSEDRLAVTGDKGYSMIRATHAVSRGSWYYEACIEEMPEGSCTRIGFAQQYGNLQAPLGYDKFGYSWRARKGSAFHECRGKHCSDEGYGEGDILGFLIILPVEPSVSYVPETYKDRPLVKFRSHLYYEEKDEVQDSLKNLHVLKGSKMMVYKNGVFQGVAYNDINAGSYYPAVSLFRNATVSVNFGPNFKFPPKQLKFRGMCEKAEESIMEQSVADMFYLTENDGKLRLDTYYM